MSLTVKLLLVAALVLGIIVPFGYYLIGEKSKKRYKRALGANVLFYFGSFAIAAIMLFAGDPVQAADTAEKAAGMSTGLGYIAAALSTGMSCVGGGLAVASAASAALGALSEDASIMGKALIFVALAESIALYGLLISFSILG